MTNILRLTITTPAQILVALDHVAAVRAEDHSGSFGVLPGHADLLTVLVPSVVHWRTADGVAGFCAVRGGVFAVSGGVKVSVACRQGVVSDSLEELEAKVRSVRAQQVEADRKTRVTETRIHAAAVRQLVRYLQSDRGSPGPIAREHLP